jgi:hypothetical protein
VVVQKVESGIAAAKAATIATTATIVASAKDIKLKKSSKPATTTTTTTTTMLTTMDYSVVDDTVQDTDTADTNDKPAEKRGLRRKAWRVVKKVVAPWRKWKNIK